MSSIIFRVVPRGITAEGYDDDDGDEMNLDQPCDLVMLEQVGSDGETELIRKEFDSGHAASAYLLSLIRKEKKNQE
jgi:hypothetical protein